MYSEHLIAYLLRFTQGTVPTGASVDKIRTRPVVTLGRIIGPDLGIRPHENALRRLTATTGVPAHIGTRAAIHLLPDGRCGFGLGGNRGVIESTGERLVIVASPEPGRYTSAWRLPAIEYGGLL